MMGAVAMPPAAFDRSTLLYVGLDQSWFRYCSREGLSDGALADAPAQPPPRRGPDGSKADSWWPSRPASRRSRVHKRPPQQKAIRELLHRLPADVVNDRGEFEHRLDAETKTAGVRLAASVRKAILSALSERDESADICRDNDDNAEPDPELRDTESVPLPPSDDSVDDDGIPTSVRGFFEREVSPM